MQVGNITRKPSHRQICMGHVVNWGRFMSAKIYQEFDGKCFKSLPSETTFAIIKSKAEFYICLCLQLINLEISWIFMHVPTNFIFYRFRFAIHFCKSVIRMKEVNLIN